MKAYKVLLAGSLMVLSAAAFAQRPQVDYGLEFTVVKENPITSIKNQNRSGTCWCFSGISFLESEAIRLNNLKEEAYPDFSEMFVVSLSYQERAEKFVRTNGHINFAAGSSCEDVVDVIGTYGIVPNTVMPGLNYGTELPVHGELDATAKAYVTAISKNPNRKLSTAWKAGFQGIVDAYLGEVPQTFKVDGKEYTPESYRDSYKINKDDYVSFTSFTHHPYYEKFALEVADNWRWSEYYNVTLDEFWQICENAIMNGYTFTWGGDVSEKAFTGNGVALLIDETVKQTEGSDQEKWVGGKEPKKADKKTDKEPKPVVAPKEKEVNAQMRQEGFDEQSTTDDHGMHAYGIAKDQFGNTYLMIKNSWGETGKYKGIWYMSKAFSQGKCLDIMVHKDAVPAEIKAKLGIK